METNSLRQGIFIFFIIIILVLIVYSFIPGDYEKTPKQALNSIISNDSVSFQNKDIHEILTGKYKNEYQLVDIRPEKDFEKGHLQNAFNIPFNHLLKREFLKKLDHSKKQLIYSKQEAKAHEAALLLLQKGFANSMAIPANYESLKQRIDSKKKINWEDITQEKPKYDYRAFIITAPHEPNITKENEQKIESTPKVEGGC